MAEPITSVVRDTAGASTDSLDKRREKIITRIRKSNAKAASAIARNTPSSQHMFAGDHKQLSMLVKLCKNLSATAERSYNARTPKGSCGGG